jgi:hypothetical protein
MTLWKDAINRSVQLKISREGIKIVYQGILIPWEDILTTHILTLPGGKYKDRHFLVINYYLPYLNSFREVEINLDTLQTSAAKVAHSIEYFRSQDAQQIEGV